MTRHRLIIWFFFGAALAMLVLVAWNRTGSFAHGYLAAFVAVSMIPIGSLALLLIQGITGGAWGKDLSAALLPAARSMPLLLIGFLPILVWRSQLYDWPAAGVPADVARYYLNPFLFALRSLVALLLWSTLVFRQAWRRPWSAGAGLALHLVLVSFIPPDWILTLRPGSTSAGFGLGFGIEQILAALGFAALLSVQGFRQRANRDLAGILLSALLGTIYFVYMQFVITWYGNIPDKVQWYVARAGDGWPVVALAAFTLGAAIPFLAMLNPGLRSHPGPMRVIGLLVLAGILLHIAWLTLPAFGQTILPAVLSLLVLGLVAVLLPHGERRFFDAA